MNPLKGAQERSKMSDFVPLYQALEGFYTRNVFNRLGDAFCRPICSVAGATVSLVERITKDSNRSFEYTGNIQHNVVNVGSYNYLGFSENDGDCAQKAINEVDQAPGGLGSSRAELGSYKIHDELESR